MPGFGTLTLVILPPLRSADAQRRYVSKQQAFGGAGTAGAAVGGESNWQSSWQRQLCDARLAAVPPYAHPLGGTCPLTSRKVRMCRWGGWRGQGLGWGSALAGLGIGLAGRALTAVLWCPCLPRCASLSFHQPSIRALPIKIKQ